MIVRVEPRRNRVLLPPVKLVNNFFLHIKKLFITAIKANQYFFAVKYGFETETLLKPTNETSQVSPVRTYQQSGLTFYSQAYLLPIGITPKTVVASRADRKNKAERNKRVSQPISNVNLCRCNGSLSGKIRRRSARLSLLAFVDLENFQTTHSSTAGFATSLYVALGGKKLNNTRVDVYVLKQNWRDLGTRRRRIERTLSLLARAEMRAILLRLSSNVLHVTSK